MKISSRPSYHYNKGYDNTVSEGCRVTHERVRFEKPSDWTARESPAVVFRCHGTPTTTHNTETEYRFSVELDLPELVAGLASTPPEMLQAAVVSMLETAESTTIHDEELEEGQTRRDCGCVTPSDLTNSINAITSGVVDFLVRKQSHVASDS